LKDESVAFSYKNFKEDLNEDLMEMVSQMIDRTIFAKTLGRVNLLSDV